MTIKSAPKAQPQPSERIEPDAEGREVMPPCGGSWVREEDGGLRPADKETAEAAGLAWTKE